MRAAARVAAVVAVVAAAAGCGGNPHQERQPDAAVNPATPVPLPTVTGTGAYSNLAVNRIVAGLRSHGLESQLTDIIVFSAETDPAHVLGEPGHYVARAAFTDSTLPPAARSQHSFARGGTVEVFTSAGAARAGATDARDRLPGERDLVSGAVVLRMSPRAPSTLVEKYRTALHATTGTAARLLT